VAFVLNFAPHYRKRIIQLLQLDLEASIYAGERTFGKIKALEDIELSDKITRLPFRRLFKNIYWLSGTISLSFKPYSKYVITGQPHGLSFWVMLFVNKILGKKTYLWTHGWYGNEHGIKSKFKKIFYKLSDGVFLYGNYAKELMLKEGFRDDELFVIYNSLDYTKQKELQKNLKPSSEYPDHFKNDLPIVVFIGRLTKEKKLDLIIEALKLSACKNPFNIVYIGDGPARAELSLKAEKDNLEDKIWFYGSCYDEKKIAELIFNADICVSPGFVGLTAMHSLVFGTPVITHGTFEEQMPEFEAIEEGKTGSFFEKNNVESLSNKISNWFENHPTKSSTVIQECMDVIDKKYNPNVQIETFKTVLS